MIKLTQHTDPQLASLFPKDPDKNIVIITSQQRLELQLSFLIVDSKYFQKLHIDQNEVDFSSYPQGPLIKVLHSLYGEQLYINNVSELIQIYPIIEDLEIQDYLQKIKQQCSKKQIIENLQFLQFSFKKQIHKDQVLDFLFKTKLKSLADSRNYIQLNKISDETLHYVLLQYIKIYPHQNTNIINQIMENYYNRKNIKPTFYLKQNPKYKRLLQIWLQNHHVQPLKTNQLQKSNYIFNDNETLQSKVFIQRTKTSYQSKLKKIQELQKQHAERIKRITQLKSLIENQKKQIGICDAQKPITARSLLFQMGRNTNSLSAKRLSKIQEIPAKIVSDFQTGQMTSLKYKNSPQQKLSNRLSLKYFKKS